MVYGSFPNLKLVGGEQSASQSSNRNCPCYPLHGKLGGPESHSEHSGEEKDLLLQPGITPQFLSHPPSSLAVILIMM
jgi:hypothetical protein